MKPYSDEMAEMFDREVKALIDNAFARTKELLESKTSGTPPAPGAGRA